MEYYRPQFDVPALLIFYKYMCPCFTYILQIYVPKIDNFILEMDKMPSAAIFFAHVLTYLHSALFG